MADDQATAGRAGERRTDVSDSQGVQVGDRNLQMNFILGRDRSPDLVRAGDVPQRPPSFQPRAELMRALDRQPDGPVVFAVTGLRGTGKTQIAAEHARRRMDDGWRLVAWVDASDEASLLSGLARVAAKMGSEESGASTQVLASRVRERLEADGKRSLLVFDNVNDLDLVRPFIPAAGDAQVIVVSHRLAAHELGAAVPVGTFSEEEALTFLADRTGLDDPQGALDVAREMGFLPLGLAQAAGLIRQDHLTGYQVYLERLRALPVTDYLRRTEGDPYQYRLAEAIDLSLRAVEARDPSGVCGELIGLMAVLAETGVSSRILRLAVTLGLVGDETAPPNPVAADATAEARLGELAGASLTEFTLDRKSLTTHRLVMRVVRERLAADGRLPAVAGKAVELLRAAAGTIIRAWEHATEVHDLAEHVTAVMDCLDGGADGMSDSLLRLRLRSVQLLNDLGDSPGLAVRIARPLADDCARHLGPSAPDTLRARRNLAVAYRQTGQLTEAIALFKEYLADGRGVLETREILAAQNDLAVAYQDANRINEAVGLLEDTHDASERILGARHPETLTTRSNLALAYSVRGRTSEAIRMYRQTLEGFEDVLPDHDPRTLAVRDSLGVAYQLAGQHDNALPLLERNLAESGRILGPDHPDTHMARNSLAVSYLAGGRRAEARPLLELAVKGLTRSLGSGHSYTKAARDNLAQITG